MTNYNPSILYSELSRLDRWIQRITAAAMLALALGLIGLGIALYAPPANATSPEPNVWPAINQTP